ncbi:MAG: helix-turn-helix transcriptional regulator [Planctomycetaceae bacterium]
MADVSDNEVRELLAANVNTLLAARGWSGHDLAREAGENPETIKRLRRASNDVRFGVIVRVAAALGTTIDDLLDSERIHAASA